MTLKSKTVYNDQNGVYISRVQESVERVSYNSNGILKRHSVSLGDGVNYSFNGYYSHLDEYYFGTFTVTVHLEESIDCGECDLSINAWESGMASYVTGLF